MEPMTRAQMVAEFGEPGVENPKIMDLIELDPASDKVVLVMIERRAWGAGPQQFRQIEEKINRYLGYVLDGHLAAHYPQIAASASGSGWTARRSPAATRSDSSRPRATPSASRAWSSL